VCVCVEGQAVGIVTVDRSVFMGLPKFTTSQLFCLLITFIIMKKNEKKKLDSENANGESRDWPMTWS
jgi:hypothetical protein